MPLTTAEQTVFQVSLLLLIGAAIYTFCRWVSASPGTPDPWGIEEENAIKGEDAVPVCPHCQTPQQHNGWFCPECGSTSGQYGNYLPSVYIFSIGEALRSGVYQPNRWSPLVIAGYILLSLGYLSILAPLYCLALFINRSQIKHLQADSAH